MKNPRRHFLQTSLLSATALTASLATGHAVFAADQPKPRLDPNDAKAKDLGYVEVANQANKAKYPTYVEGQRCSNCVLYTKTSTSTPDAAQGVCDLFPNVVVPGDAWCKAWEET